MRIFSGKACFSPSVSDYLLEAWVMHGGTLTMDKEDNRNAVYFFCDGSSDPWFRKLSARSIVVIHPNWIRDAVDENFPVPIARYVINVFGLTDDYEYLYTALNQDCEGDSDDSGSDQSQQEVLEQLLARYTPSPSPNSKSSTLTTQTSSTNINQISKRPHISDDSESHEDRLFKIPRFLSPNSSMIRCVSRLTIRPTDSQSVLTSQAQTLERPQDCTDHATCYYEPEPFKSPPRERPCYKSSTTSNETPDGIKRVGRVANLDLIDKATTNEADKTADTANQSDSTLVGSTSAPNISFSSSSKINPTSKSKSQYPNIAHEFFWSQAILSCDPPASPSTLPKSETGLKRINSVPFLPQPLRVSVRKFLRSVSTTKPQASLLSPAMYSTTVAIGCEDSIKHHDEKEQERLGEHWSSCAESKAEVTLFVAGKMYMGKEMKYLGRD